MSVAEGKAVTASLTDAAGTDPAMTAATVAGVAAKAGIDLDGLAATLAAYNAQSNGLDPAGKPADQVVAQDQPPYSLIDFSIRPRLMYPAPVLTLGDLVVDHATGQVLSADGTAVPGLYATGRSAVGLCSLSDVSGPACWHC